MKKKDDTYLRDKGEKFKLGIGTLLVALFLVLVFGIVQIQDNSYGKGTVKDTVTEVQKSGNLRFIKSGETKWEYIDDAEIPGIDNSGKKWTNIGYESIEWKTAKGSFGSFHGELSDRVGGKNPTKLLNHYTEDQKSVPVYYFRTEFEIENLDDISQITGEVQFDDAIVIYLNGIEIYTDNQPQEGFDPANGYGAEVGVDTSWTRVFTIADISALKEGTNCIAVEIHQINEDSSDIYFDFKELEGIPVWENGEVLDTKGMMLQPGNTERQLNINWLTARKGGYSVQYCKKQDDFRRYMEIEMELTEVEGQYCYKARLFELASDETYSYRIYDRNSGAYSEIYEFETPDKERRVDFLFAGDPQIGAGENTEIDGIGWERTLDVGRKILNEVDFIVSAGDQNDSADVEMALEEYYEFRRPEALKSIPIAVNKGNHDTVKNLYDKQFLWPGADEYSDYYFEYGDVLVVSINSNNNEYATHIGYLEKAIQNSQPEWIIVTMHYSMFSGGPHSEEEKIEKLREGYAEAFSNLDVDLVLSGHDHLYSRSYFMNGLYPTKKISGLKEKGETLYLTGTSSTGNKFYSGESADKEYLAFCDNETNKFPLISAISIQENMLTIKTIRVTDLKVFDECTIMK